MDNKRDLRAEVARFAIPGAILAFGVLLITYVPSLTLGLLGLFGR